MFMKPRTIEALVKSRLAARLAKAEAALTEGVQQIERERFDALSQVHSDFDSKQEALKDLLVESVIGPEPKA
jgi:hypothetical protein